MNTFVTYKINQGRGEMRNNKSPLKIKVMKILRQKFFSSSPRIRVSRLETWAGSKELGADGGSSRKFVTDDGYEFDDPVITHWKGTEIVGFTDRRTGRIIKDPEKRFKEELDRINKKKESDKK